MAEPKSPRRTIRFFPDYGRGDWPLWEDGAADPNDYGLSAELVRDLSKWNLMFLEHFTTRWDRRTVRERWRVLGEDIAHRLQDEVAAFCRC